MATKRARVGRPPTRAKAGQKKTLGIRAPADLANQLSRAAARNDRSLSQEAELRLERSFRDESLLPQLVELAYGHSIGGLARLVAEAMVAGARHSALLARAAPLEDPAAEAQTRAAAIDAARTILDAAAPSDIAATPALKKTGRPELDSALAAALGRPGRSAAIGLLHAIATPGGIGGTQGERADELRHALGAFLGDIIHSAPRWRALAPAAIDGIHGSTTGKEQ